MAIVVDYRKSAQENASGYYSLSKELAKKAEGARKAIAETEAEIAAAQNSLEAARAKKDAPAMRRRKEWQEKYKWFVTSGGKMVLAGRDAKQNDQLVSKLMAEDDLFFHADIQGAPATILVGGKGASGQEKKEAAQFAASHSSAWKVGAAAVDAYAVGKEQLSKHSSGGFVGAGGFAIKGEREWFKGTALGLACSQEEGKFICLPLVHSKAEGMALQLSPGRMEKGKAAKDIAKMLKCDVDEVLLMLPSGCFALKKLG